jgi:hypothetical protein
VKAQHSTEIHDRQVEVVRDAVAKLFERFGPKGLLPEAVFEGSVKGGAIALIAGSNATADEVANLLETIAEGFRHLDRPQLRVVS